MEAELARACAATLARHGRSFRWAQLLLGRREREDAALAYAFCRVLDDCVDESSDPAAAARELDAIEAALDGRAPAPPLIRAYVELCARRGIGLEPARALLAGMRGDLEPVRVADDAELGLYCYRVAGTVGLVMCGLLGVKETGARGHAISLGVAMQLTNICRDVREDALRGRIYLPRTHLARHGLTPEELLDVAAFESSPERRQRLANVCRELLAQAEEAYAFGLAGLRFMPRRARWAIAVAAELYRGIGRRLLRRRGGDPFTGRERVPAPLKCVLAARALVSLASGTTSPAAARLPAPLLLPSLPP